MATTPNTGMASSPSIARSPPPLEPNGAMQPPPPPLPDGATAAGAGVGAGVAVGGGAPTTFSGREMDFLPTVSASSPKYHSKSPTTVKAPVWLGSRKYRYGLLLAGWYLVGGDALT